MSARVERLRAVCEDPFLVGSPVNVRWLTGLESSNAVLLVEPDRLRVFTDLRYVEKAHAAGIEVVEVARDAWADLPVLLPPRVGFESEHLVYAAHESLARGGAELVPRRDVVRGLRAVKDEDDLAAIRHAAEITYECFHRLAEQRFVGRTGRELA